jgi:hypothetical protein
LRARLFVALALALAGPARAGELPFSAVVTLELADQTVVALGSAAGRATRLADDRLVFPALELVTPVAAAFTPPPPSCVSPFEVLHEGLEGGTLAALSEEAAGAGGFGGALPLSGSLVVDALAGALGGLEAPLRAGAQASPAARAYTTAPDASAPPAQAFLSLSYSRWTTAPADLTGTRDGAITLRWQAGGSLLSTAGGAQEISLVAPMHVHTGGIDAGGATLRRTLPIAGRMTIRLPAPPLLASEAVALVSLLALAIRRTRSK